MTQLHPTYRLLRSDVAQNQTHGFTPWAIGEIYQFPLLKDIPANLPKKKIVLIELGGGIQQSDIESLVGQRYPGVKLDISTVKLGSYQPTFNATDGACIECMLDASVALSIAPFASVVMVYGDNSPQGFEAALHYALGQVPDAVSISWGSAEETWDQPSIDAMESILQQFTCPVFVSAGDSGADDGMKTPSVNYPASSPHVIACGGSSLQITQTAAGTFIVSGQTVWDDNSLNNATGGGVSTLFKKPAFQNAIATPALSPNIRANTMRGLPDIAADADPETGYIIVVDGKPFMVGGTSAVAPLYAGYFALVSALHPDKALSKDFLASLYEPKFAKLWEITQGNNGWWTAHKGWNPCCGLGSIVGDIGANPSI